MEDIMNTKPQIRPLTAEESKAKTAIIIAYSLFAIGFLTVGIFTFIALVYVLVKSGSVKYTIFADHFSKIKSLSIWTFVFWVIGILAIAFYIGYLILFAIVILWIFTIIKGFVKILNNESYKGNVPTFDPADSTQTA